MENTVKVDVVDVKKANKVRERINVVSVFVAIVEHSGHHEQKTYSLICDETKNGLRFPRMRGYYVRSNMKVIDGLLGRKVYKQVNMNPESKARDIATKKNLEFVKLIPLGSIGHGLGDPH